MRVHELGSVAQSGGPASDGCLLDEVHAETRALVIPTANITERE